MKTVEQVMSSDVVTIGATRTAADAIALMLERDAAVLPVVDDGDRLVGLITMRDLLRALPYRPVVEVMRQDIQMISPRMPLSEAYTLLERQRTGQLPVADEGRVVATGAVPIGALAPGDYVVHGVIRLEDGTTGRVTRTLRKALR